MKKIRERESLFSLIQFSALFSSASDKATFLDSNPIITNVSSTLGAASSRMYRERRGQVGLYMVHRKYENQEATEDKG